LLGECPAPFHASDGFFYAAENRVSFGLGIINGLSLVIDLYERITAEGAINERGVIVGEIFTASGKTLYTLFSDWFGWLMVIGLAGLLVVSHPRPE
jgi:apolipoprotein N-acyltransferase